MLLRGNTPIDGEDGEDEEEFLADESIAWRERLRDWIMQHPRDAVGLLVAAATIIAIAINALFLQTGPHPAPLFALPQPIPDQRSVGHTAALPRARPAPQQALGVPPTRVDLVARIQRGLATRGYYDGAVDGIYGPKTDSAVRDFAQAAELTVGLEPDEALLRSILSSPVKDFRPAAAVSLTRVRHDPIADLIGPSSRILAVQRALSDFGYGQINPTGVPDPDTVEAIERFERARHLPVTGVVSERLIRELAAVTGRPLE